MGIFASTCDGIRTLQKTTYLNVVDKRVKDMPQVSYKWDTRVCIGHRFMLNVKRHYEDISSVKNQFVCYKYIDIIGMNRWEIKSSQKDWKINKDHKWK